MIDRLSRVSSLAPSTGRVVTVVAVIWLAVVTVVGVSPASAHTDLLQGSPGPGQTVGGQVDFLDLVYAEPVSDVSVTITGPDREQVEGEIQNTEGLIIRYQMEPLTEPGRYIVRYNMDSADGDRTNSGFFFEYDEAATQPFRLGDADLPSQTAATIRQFAVYLLAACLVGLIGLQFISLRRKQRMLALQKSSKNPD